MKDWYTRKEVAEILGVSKATVYHYAKQGKIIKIDDPHRLYREARYQKEEVDALAEERKKNQPTGLRPSELAKELNVPSQRIYTLIRETDLPIDRLPAGDERTIYSIPEQTANWIRKEIKKQQSTRGTRAEFYNATYDIALYQLFQTKDGEKMRVVRNEQHEWGFYLPSGTWIPYTDGRDIFKYQPVYSLHQSNRQVQGYTDFVLPKKDENIFIFIDFVYEVFGIENIRMREQKEQIELSIKSGKWKIPKDLKDPLSLEWIRDYIALGELFVEDDHWIFMSGYRRTTFDLPNKLLDQLKDVADEHSMSMSEYVEKVLKEKLKTE